MANKKKKVPFDSESISRHRKWRPEHFQISNEPKSLRAGWFCGCGVLYPKRQGQNHRCLRAGQGSRRRGNGAGRILRRGMPDGAAGALSDRNNNDGMRDHAAGESDDNPRPP